LGRRSALWCAYKKQTLDGGNPHKPCPSCEWHFVNIEITNPSLDEACFGYPTLTVGMVARLIPLSQVSRYVVSWPRGGDGRDGGREWRGREL
jgi:hypothetical protein